MNKRSPDIFLKLDNQKTDLNEPFFQCAITYKCNMWVCACIHVSCVCVSMYLCAYRTTTVAGCIHHDKPADSATVTCNHTSLRLTGLQSENEWQFIDMKTSYIFVFLFFFSLPFVFWRRFVSFVVKITCGFFCFFLNHRFKKNKGLVFAIFPKTVDHIYIWN